jgi:hypothetical protein
MVRCSVGSGVRQDFFCKKAVDWRVKLYHDPLRCAEFRHDTAKRRSRRPSWLFRVAQRNSRRVQKVCRTDAADACGQRSTATHA